MKDNVNVLLRKMIKKMNLPQSFLNNLETVICDDDLTDICGSKSNVS